MFKSMWIFSLASLALASPPADICVCLPGQSCWPSSNDWNTFNTSVGGKLEIIHPVAMSCHDPTFNNDVCKFVTEQYTNSSWRADQIGTLLTHRV